MNKSNPLFTNESKIACIINPKAANLKWKRRRFLRRYLQKNFPGQIIDSHKDKTFTIETAKKLSSSHDIIVVAGGDGTIADVIHGIITCGRAKKPAMGIIPLGSGNGCRKSVKVPRNIFSAVKLIKKGKPREIDLIKIDGKTACFVSIGATGAVTIDKLRNPIHGLFGHLWAAKLMLKYPKKEVDVELIDGIDDSGEQFSQKILNLNVFDCIINKTKHFGYSWRVAPLAKIDDGYLDITFFETKGWVYLLCFPLIYFGLFQKTQKHFKAKQMTIRGKDLAAQYNGEPFGVEDEIKLKVLPRALKVISSLDR